MTDSHDWMTLHRVKFSSNVDGNNNPFLGPEEADIWRFSPNSPISDDGLLTNVSDEWGGFALFDNKADAMAVVNAPEDHLPFLEQSVESWHALVIPYAHRGEVKWRDFVQENSAIRVAETDPKGPMVILTSAGYTDPGPQDIPRIKEFLAGVHAVIEFYGTLPDNLRRAVFAGAGVDGREGCTMTLWKNDRAMLGAAYKNGVHKEQLARHQQEDLFDRSSFTRGRVIASKGTWGGSDPISELSA